VNGAWQLEGPSRGLVTANNSALHVVVFPVDIYVDSCYKC